MKQDNLNEPETEEKLKLTPELIYGFVNELLAKQFDNRAETPEFHMELWTELCSEDPLVAVAAPRGHAKSTAGTHSYGLANILFRTADFICIVSDTEGQAVNFLGDIKAELLENDDLAELFGVVRPLKKDREAEFIVRFSDGHMCKVIAKGAEQKLRGMIWRSKRPNLFICDDLENDEIVMNDERRKKFRQWFLSALMNAGSKTAKFRVVGTILHMDSLLESFMPPIDCPHTVDTPLVSYSTDETRAWRSKRYRAHNPDFSELLWPEQFDKDYFVAKRQTFIDQGYPEGYTQEFLNYPIDEATAYFRSTDLRPLTEDNVTEEFYVGIDLAISQKDASAFSVFVVCGLTPDSKLRVRDVIRFRGDSLDIIDCIFDLHYQYSPEIMFIEQENIARTLGPILNKEMEERGTFPRLEPMTASQDKPKRARALQARMRRGMVEFDMDAPWFATLQTELLQFPRGKFMDQVDSLAWIALGLDKMYSVPTNTELEEEEYQQDLEDSSDMFMMGASEITGY